MNNLNSRVKSLGEVVRFPSDPLSRRHRFQDEAFSEPNAERFAAPGFRVDSERYAATCEMLLQPLGILFFQQVIPPRYFSLLGVSRGPLGISACVPQLLRSEGGKELPARTYVKNGILVHQVGKRITSEDVADGLAEE